MTDHVPTEPHALAAAVAESMFARDSASRGLGMQIVRVAPGEARMSMTVRPDMLNGHAICHGGFIFTLADSAFAFACNSGNVNTVASGCSIEFLAPAQLGDVLTAAARVRAQVGRSGIYDVEVVNQDGVVVAHFRGKSTRIKGSVLEGPSP